MSYGKPGGANGAFAVTPSDSADLADNAAGLYIGGAGDVSIVCVDGSTAVFTGAPTGLVLPVAVRRVNSAGTTATNIVALKQ